MSRHQEHDNTNLLNEIFGKHIRIPELSDIEIGHLNRIPVNEVSHFLINLFKTSTDDYVKSRSFDGLMHLAGFDRLVFLRGQLKDLEDPDWRIVCIEALGDISGSDSLELVCHTLLNDEDSDVRFVAASVLCEIGNISVLPALDHAIQYDLGVDYEGRPIASVAWQAAQKIRAKLELYQSIDVLIAEYPPRQLRSLVGELSKLGNHLSIYSSCDDSLSETSLMIPVPPIENRYEIYTQYDLKYFLEVVQARKILADWTDQHSRIPEISEACAILIEYVLERNL